MHFSFSSFIKKKLRADFSSLLNRRFTASGASQDLLLLCFVRAITTLTVVIHMKNLPCSNQFFFRLFSHFILFLCFTTSNFYSMLSRKYWVQCTRISSIRWKIPPKTKIQNPFSLLCSHLCSVQQTHLILFIKYLLIAQWHQLILTASFSVEHLLKRWESSLTSRCHDPCTAEPIQSTGCILPLP